MRKSPLLSDPYLVGMVMPALAVVRRMADRMADVMLVEEGQHDPEVVQSIETSGLGVMEPGLSPVELVTERYSMRVGGKPVVALEVKTLLVDGATYDVDLVCSWHPQVEVEMSALLKRMQVNLLALLMGLGMNLRPRVEQLPSMLLVHLGQPQKGKAKANAMRPPFGPAEAACDSAMPLYMGHHSDGYYDHPAPVACGDDHPDFDAPGECQGCENFALCHPHVAEAEAEHVEALRRAA